MDKHYPPIDGTEPDLLNLTGIPIQIENYAEYPETFVTKAIYDFRESYGYMLAICPEYDLEAMDKKPESWTIEVAEHKHMMDSASIGPFDSPSEASNAALDKLESIENI